MQNETPFKYRAFGLNIQSDFEIVEMQRADFDRPDVTVTLAETPEKIENPEREGVRFQMSGNEFLLNVDNVARYYVADGSSIRIEKLNGSTFQEVRLFLLGVVFSALLHQKGMVPFHASSLLQDEGKSFLMCGRSGIGKSTLTAYFIKRGFRLLSDDISVVKQNEGEIWAHPSFPFIKLWKDVMEHVDFSPEEGARLRESIEKYGYRMAEAFHPEPAAIDRVFVLNVHNREEYKTEELKGIEKFNVLKNQTFRFQFITDRNRSGHFTVLNEMARAIPIYRITRPQAPMDSESLYEVIRRML